jgi:hypothetical protein
MVTKNPASAVQKENFRTRFEEIIKNNADLKDQYSIQFFETAQKVITALPGATENP